MTRTNSVAVQNNFSKGLITEATGLAFPENACTETYNCIFNHFGKVERRLGFDFEDGFTDDAETLDNRVIVTYLWENVASEGDITFVVAQVGNVLKFYRVGAGALSAGLHGTEIDLLSHDSGVGSVASLECQFSSGNGQLFVTGRRINTFRVEYDVDTDALSASTITIQIRDFEGDPADTEAVTTRVTSTVAGLDANHRYNLENIGWTATTLAAWDTAQTTMPSLADVPWYFKATSEPGTAMDFSLDDNPVTGNSPAPKGHFIYSVYDVDRSTNVAGATDFEIALDRVTTSAFFAGRVFYSGLQAPMHSSRIYFSQIIEEETQYGKCYQTNDPTSETLFDLLPSDGGVIDILEAGTILKMVPVLNALVVFATNGIWTITGNQGIGFTANDYSINKISSLTNTSVSSFVDVEGMPFWWNLEGIYTIQLDPQSKAMNVVSITDQSIRSFFLDIPPGSKQFAKGTYDQFSKTIVWVYRSTVPELLTEKYAYDRVLNFNLLNRAFYPWTVTGFEDNIRLHGVVSVFGQGGESVPNEVVDGADNVIDGTDNVIVFGSDISSVATTVVKYLTSHDHDAGESLTWSETLNDMYVDWASETDVTDGTYDSYFVTGYIVRGQASRKFQQNYVNIYSDNDVDTSFVIRGQWDFANASGSNRWSQPQTLTVPAGDFDYKGRRVKIRGHGKACQIRINSNENDPFHLIGWSVFETGNQWV